MTLPKLSHKPPTPPLTHKHTHIPISVSPTTGTLQKLEQITPLCACSHSDCCYIQIGFQVASCVLQRPMGYGPAHYTWGLLPKSTEACVQPIAPHPSRSRLGRRGPYPLCSPQHTHFHHQSLQLITVIGLSGIRSQRNCHSARVKILVPYMGASVAEPLTTVGEILLRATVKVETSFFCLESL